MYDETPFGACGNAHADLGAGRLAFQRLRVWVVETLEVFPDQLATLHFALSGRSGSVS